MFVCNLEACSRFGIRIIVSDSGTPVAIIFPFWMCISFLEKFGTMTLNDGEGMTSRVPLASGELLDSADLGGS